MNFPFAAPAEFDPAPLSSLLSPADRRAAYGLRFHSQFALSELPVDAEPLSEADVRIELGQVLSRDEVAQLTAPDTPIEGVMRFEEAWCQLLFSDVGRYTLREGRHVLVEPLEGTSESSWRLPLLGAVMALLLEQRGLLALHGGAARFSDGAGQDVAAGFLGDKGQGKSTLNAALSQAGFALLCDDVLAVSGLDAPASAATPSQAMTPVQPTVPGEPVALSEPTASTTQGGPMALSGFAWLKLAPDAVRGVWNAEPDEFALVAPEVAETDKRSVPARLAPDALPLRALFILSSLPDEASEPVALRRMNAQEALLHLIPHTFAARFGGLYLKDARQRAHFRACSRLAGECAVWELARKRDLALLPRTVRAIEKAVRESALSAPSEARVQS